MSRICFVGAGFISRIHADAVSLLPGQEVVSVVDVNRSAAQRLAGEIGAVGVFSSVQEALADDTARGGVFDRAHVLVPPDLHRVTTLPLLLAGKGVLLEKPLGVTVAECEELVAAGVASGAALGVNQNFVHHPAFTRLRGMIEAGALGHPTWVGCTYNVPLRPLAARQFGSWMFREPGNILLEQAVHPLSMIAALAGPIRSVSAVAGPAMDLVPGVPFVKSLDALLTCERMPAQLRFAVGQNFPFWQVTVVCDDGVVVADILANRVFTYGRTRWVPALDEALSGLRTSGSVAAGSLAGLIRYGLSTAKLRPRSDAFFLSMVGSLGAFHAALDDKRSPELDGLFGTDLIRVCETIRDQAFPTKTAAALPLSTDRPPCDVAVLGGTGFIGLHVVRRLLDAGLRVAVMARSVTNLSALLLDPRVVVHRGDIRDATAVSSAIRGVPIVVNLAHGGGGADFEALRAAMVGGAETVARACLEKGVRRLVHVGSTASLYLGPQHGSVTDATPPDPDETKRGDYARAKVLADRLLLEMHARDGLPVVILRPGIVVGEGTSPFHSGVGLFNNDQHCIGWSDGRNPLPFVLVEDVAEAVFLATRAPDVDGRAFNIVGDVRLSAREYMTKLSQSLGRPLHFHPQSPRWLWLEDSGKWVIKRIGGRKVQAPSIRDFLSRGMTAKFDTSTAQRDLGWRPVSDRARFIERAILVHA